MSPIAVEVLDVLASSDTPIRADSLGRILFVTGFDTGGATLSAERIEAALEELMTAGRAERIWRRGAAHYKALESRQVGTPAGGQR